MAKYTGVATTFEEARKNAVAKALQAQHTSDPMVVYEIQAIRGRSGGIAAFNEVEVTIEEVKG